MLAGKVIGRCEGFAASIDQVYPDKDRARLVLIGIASGGTGCQLTYKLVEIGADGSAIVTDEFGNCNRVQAIRRQTGAWYYDLYGDVDGTQETWVFRIGKMQQVRRTAPP